jgi:transposase InsO family protein
MNTIMVVVDQGCTKGMVLIPCTTHITSEETAELYMQHIWKRFGLPQKVISDRGTQFASKFTRELCKKLGIQQNLSMAYHPETDGETERVNQELEQYLQCFCDYMQDNWMELLPTAKFSHNIRWHLTIRQSPFQALMGYEPRILDITNPTSSNPAIEEQLKLLLQIRNKIHASSQTASEIVKTNRNKTNFTPYSVGDKV